ncbi:hypothetical protein OA960_00780 [Pelagibacteraceae bacterium]|nr:hypothetical protein [Pelagibacteraceae bacterium]
MIRTLIIGSVLNIILLFIFLIIYFYSNFFLLNKHYFKIEFDKKYIELNNLVQNESDFIIDYYYNLFRYNDPSRFAIDLNSEILQIVDPIVYKDLANEDFFWRKVFGELELDKKNVPFKTNRNHDFDVINNELYLSIQSEEKKLAEYNAKLILDEINKVYKNSIYQNSYNKIIEKINIQIQDANLRIEFLNKNNQIVYEQQIIGGKNYLIASNKNEKLEEEFKILESLKLKLIKINNAYYSFGSNLNEENNNFLVKNFDYTYSFNEFPLSLIFIFIAIQIIIFCYSFYLRYYLK